MVAQFKVKQLGFTLIELLMVMSLVLISALMVLPCVHTYLNKYAVETTFIQLDSMLQGARWQAIQSGHRMGVCGSSDGEHCDGLWSSYVLAYDLQSKLIINHFKSSEACGLKLSASLGVRDRVVFTVSGTNFLGQQGHFYCVEANDSFNPILKLSRNGSTAYILN